MFSLRSAAGYTIMILVSSLLFGETIFAQTTVLRDVQVLTMETESILEDQTLIIRDGKVEWMGNSTDATVPNDAEVIDGPLFVMPGLAEMHAHIPSENEGRLAMEDALVLYLSQGITTIRGMLGQPAHLELREDAANGEIVSPRIFTSGPSFSGGTVNDPEQARQMVRDQADAGYDLLKLHPGLSVEQFDAISETANDVGIEFSGHVSHAVGLERSLNAGQGTIDHLDRYMEFLAGDPEDREDPNIIYFGYDLADEVGADESRLNEAAQKTIDAGTWNVPTHTLLHNVFNPGYTPEMMKNWPGMDFMPRDMVENWADYVSDIRRSSDYDAGKAQRFLEIRDRLLITLHEAGARIMLGADAPQIFNPPGFSAHRELDLYVSAGMTPFEALQTGTVNVAEYLGESGNAGIIREGARADLVLLDANPLETLPFREHISGVVANGIYYSETDLSALLDEIRERNR
ncbi:MAG: amidohydrolase family protein [Balneolaceae bacterium]